MADAGVDRRHRPECRKFFADQPGLCSEPPLLVASPITTGATFVLIALNSVLPLGEAFGLLKLAGVVLDLCGIVLPSQT